MAVISIILSFRSLLLTQLFCYWFLLVYFSFQLLYCFHLCLFFKSSSSLLNIFCILIIYTSILFPRFWIMLTIVTLNSYSLVAQSKVSAHNEGDLGLIPGLGRSPGEGNENPLQYSCLENSMDRGWEKWWWEGKVWKEHLNTKPSKVRNLGITPDTLFPLPCKYSINDCQFCL